MSTENIQTAFQLLRDELFHDFAQEDTDLMLLCLDCLIDVRVTEEKYNKALAKLRKRRDEKIIPFPVNRG